MGWTETDPHLPPGGNIHLTSCPIPRTLTIVNHDKLASTGESDSFPSGKIFGLPSETLTQFSNGFSGERPQGEVFWGGDCLICLVAALSFGMGQPPEQEGSSPLGSKPEDVCCEGRSNSTRRAEGVGRSLAERMRTRTGTTFLHHMKCKCVARFFFSKASGDCYRQPGRGGNFSSTLG